MTTPQERLAEIKSRCENWKIIFPSFQEEYVDMDWLICRVEKLEGLVKQAYEWGSNGILGYSSTKSDTFCEEAKKALEEG